MLVTSIELPSEWKHKCLTNSYSDGPWQNPWKTKMYLISPDSVQMTCESGQRAHLTRIHDNAGFFASCDSSHIICMPGETHTSSHTHQDNFDTDGVFIGIDNCCYVTMSHF